MGGEKGVTYRVRDDKGREKNIHFNQLKPAVEREVARRDNNPDGLEGHKEDRKKTSDNKKDEAIEPHNKNDDRIKDGELIAYFFRSRLAPVQGGGGPPPAEYVTRSGRISRPPVRFPE